ncbi:MAG TPA: hypothetical protein VF252_08565 [Gemmatimonadales bacterium]
MSQKKKRPKAAKRKADPNQLFAEMMQLVKSAGPPPGQPSAARRLSPKTRLARLKKALGSDDPLPNIRALIPDDGANAQAVVVHAFACILETGSAGLSVLVDRFEDDELAKIISSLEAIGARATLADLRQLRAALQRAVQAGQNRLDAAELVAEGPGKRIDRHAELHVREMGERLLEFCRTRLEELAAG